MSKQPCGIDCPVASQTTPLGGGLSVAQGLPSPPPSDAPAATPCDADAGTPVAEPAIACAARPPVPASMPELGVEACGPQVPDASQRPPGRLGAFGTDAGIGPVGEYGPGPRVGIGCVVGGVGAIGDPGGGFVGTRIGPGSFDGNPGISGDDPGTAETGPPTMLDGPED